MNNTQLNVFVKRGVARNALLFPFLSAFLLALLFTFAPSTSASGSDFDLEIRTNAFSNLHIAEDVIEVTCRLRGLGKRLDGLVFECDVIDRQDNSIRRFKRRARVFRSGFAETKVTSFRLASPGLYSLRARAIHHSQMLANSQTTLAVVHAAKHKVPPEEVPFGLILHAKQGLPSAKIAEQLDTLDVKWVKIPIYWQNLDYSQLDGLITRLHARNIHVVAQILGISRNASRTQDATRCGEIGPRYASMPPAHWDIWDAFIAEIAERYRERIHYWEIWMDPEGGQGPNWQGTAEDFARLFEQASRIIKEHHPQAHIVNPALLGQPQDFGRLLAQTTVALTDIVGFSTSLSRPMPGVELPEKWREVASVAPLWNTDSRGGGPTDLVRDYVKARALGIDRVFWHSYHEFTPTRGAGTFTKDNFIPTHNAIAYAEVSRLLEGFDFKKPIPMPGETVCYLFENELKNIVVLWHKDSSFLGGQQRPVGLHLGTWMPEKYTIYGRKETLWPNLKGNVTLWVGEEPVFLKLSSSARVRAVEPKTWQKKQEDISQWTTFEPSDTAQQNPHWKHVVDRNLSEGKGLRLIDTPQDSQPLHIQFRVEKTGDYKLLFAGTPLSEVPWKCSSFQWQVDGNQVFTVNRPGIEQRVYGDGKAALTPLGNFYLGSGTHTFLLWPLSAPAYGANQHNLTLDALVLEAQR